MTMADDKSTGNVFDALRKVRVRTEEERARREGRIVDGPEAVDGTAGLEETVSGTETPEDHLDETAERVKAGIKDFGRALDRQYKRTTEAVRDAHLGERAKATAGKVAEGIGAIRSGGRKGMGGKLRDIKDKLKGVGNPVKQLGTLKGLADLVMLYDPNTGSNQALWQAGGLASSVLAVGNSLQENKQLVNDLVDYVEACAGEIGYPVVSFNQFEDFEKYMAEHAGQGRECRIVRLNSSYFVKGSNMRSNSNLLRLFRAAADPKGIAILLAEDIDLLYSQHGDRTEVLNSNARCTGLKRVVEQHSLKGVYKGNWLLVCTTADEDGLPDTIEKIVKTKL